VVRHDRLKITKGSQKAVELAKLCHLKGSFVKTINAFPYIAMLVIVILLILMFGGYFQ
jgi:hypothetical protein